MVIKIETVLEGKGKKEKKSGVHLGIAIERLVEILQYCQRYEPREMPSYKDRREVRVFESVIASADRMENIAMGYVQSNNKLSIFDIDPSQHEGPDVAISVYVSEMGGDYFLVFWFYPLELTDPECDFMLTYLVAAVADALSEKGFKGIDAGVSMTSPEEGVYFMFMFKDIEKLEEIIEDILQKMNTAELIEAMGITVTGNVELSSTIYRSLFGPSIMESYKDLSQAVLNERNIVSLLKEMLDSRDAGETTFELERQEVHVDMRKKAGLVRSLLELHKKGIDIRNVPIMTAERISREMEKIYVEIDPITSKVFFYIMCKSKEKTEKLKELILEGAFYGELSQEKRSIRVGLQFDEYDRINGIINSFLSYFLKLDFPSKKLQTPKRIKFYKL